MIEPQHVVQRVDKSFIVSHGAFSEQHRVCEMTKVDNILITKKSYGCSRGRELGQLNTPHYIALDKDERVFVADYENGRVLLLDKQLNIQRLLLTWSHDRPKCLFYDRETTQLLVGLESGQVEIFSLTQPV
jgi:hypothetical protein